MAALWGIEGFAIKQVPMTPEEFEEACKLMKLYDLYVPDITDIPSIETPATIVDKIEADGFPSLWDEPTTREVFRCDQCDLRFDTRKRLGVHTYTHNRTCGICGILFKDQTRLKEHTASCTPGAYTFDCDLCKLRFLNRPALMTHRASHAKTCAHCGKRFRKKTKYDLHVRVCGNPDMFRKFVPSTQ
jgi:hypothetical protein